MVKRNVALKSSHSYSYTNGMYGKTSNSDPQNTVVRRLTTVYTFWKMRRCANVIEFTYTNLDSIAYYTPRLYGIAYCS